ncbi:hypothetical protein [Acidocella sp.]|uniref:hypothetical protein n=1 Tax=Acidocella sp. TaxID=50710 RepID=UPI00262C975C|nr:hypothetical protein [Acidocella sp.]MDD2794346.1 hypothetical protein [Acidocella sp.]
MQDLSNGDQSLIQWFIGVMGTMMTGIGALFLHVYSKIESARSTAASGDRDLWTALNGERDNSRDFREDMIRTVASLPTKADHLNMETRIMTAIKEMRK